MKPAGLTLVAMAAALIITQSASAVESRWYAEAGYHHVSIDSASTVGLASVDAGVNLGFGFSVEAMVAQGIVGDSPQYYSGREVDAGTWYGVAGKYAYSFGDAATLYAKVRATSFSGNGFSSSGSSPGDRWWVGGGIGGTIDLSVFERGMSEQVYGIFEYNLYRDGAHGAFFGIGMKF